MFSFEGVELSTKRPAPLAQLVLARRLCPEQPPEGRHLAEGEQLFATVEVSSEGIKYLQKRPAPLAQLVEQLTLNQWVPGSSP